MSKETQREPRSKAPTGMAGKRVNMPLTPEELEELEARAKRESRSNGSMARLIYLEGLAAIRLRTPENPQVSGASC